ncbi:erythromycin esterase family protein [Scytonema sp. UIC 10036]|uniref:erythromycin esterase family protein n=1 Tax=Scytonema sp. UIC 10036 TaxID=2304196 RepID=UPI0012DA205C|nr:erythromycin esterase family protein [Scytonema sp. UIC 10036]MUG97391.1 erythromycin esterase family protein [Scytonema sp. UIC 10036]
MANTSTTKLSDAVRQAAHPLTGTSEDYDPLLELIGDARFVLIGEATHGTHEFYEQRAEITKRLIQEKGFTAVAVEADWPDAYRVNCYVRGVNDDQTPAEALSGFQRFPTWMWRNTDVVNFIGWLRQYNDSLPQNATKAGFYGLDLYSMYSSIDEVVGYLDKVDPEAAKKARHRYSCLEHFGEDSQAYGYAVSFDMSESCEQEVINQLMELQRKTGEYGQRDGRVKEDEFFYAEQNARLVKSAEEYYRSMFQGRVSSWNVRDKHMAETLDRLVAHFDSQGNRTKVVVWEHNSHLGDARATDMSSVGELNVGQLVRERYDRDAVLVGFTTYTGTVTAASRWGGIAQLKQVLPGLPDSYEALFHDTGLPRFLLNLQQDNEAVTALNEPRLERAIGVIYLPKTERVSHYFHTNLPKQFDAVIHIDDTTGVESIDRNPHWQMEEAPETFPTGM